MMSSYTNDDTEIGMLNDLCSVTGSPNYSKFINKEGRSLLGILQVFNNCKVPVERLIEFLPALLPRPYSIASSPLIPSTIRFVVSVIEVDSNMKGVCSGWLQEKVNKFIENEEEEENVEISFYFRKPNAFRLPIDLSKPMILIGPGAGVAPYIGFLEHLKLIKEKTSTFEHGPIYLFFGCRYSDKDFLFKKDLFDYVNSGLLYKFSTSFSRESEKKMYVQDNVMKNSNEIVNKILNDDATIYVCGDAKNMMTDVKTAIISCMQKHGNMQNKEAEEYVASMLKSNRYIQDIWI